MERGSRIGIGTGTRAGQRVVGRAQSQAENRCGTRRAGFTILEVVLAMGILVIGMTVLLSLFTFGAALSRSAEMRTSAATAVDAVLADLSETFFPLLPDGTVGPPVAIEARRLAAAPGVVYSALPTENPDRPGEFRVDVAMWWEGSGVRRGKEFTTILLQEIPFGERMRRRFVEGDGSALPGRTGRPGHSGHSGSPRGVDGSTKPAQTASPEDQSDETNGDT